MQRTNLLKIFPKRKLTLRQKEALYGRLFILPWLIGLVIFFIIPFINSIYYTFHKIRLGDNGLEFEFIGWENYIYAFTKDPDYLKNLTSSITNMLYEVPIVIIFSVFVAYLLKDDFKGRTFARTIFFFPVIIASGVVITVLKENVLGSNTSSMVASSTTIFKAENLRAVMINAGVPRWFSMYIVDIVNKIFDLTWRSGVQILLILAALHNIPKSFYEVAIIEGATEWEKFWKITFPMISPTILVAVIYSIIDYFTDYGNQVMRMVVNQANNGKFEYSTTLAITYFLVVMIIILIVNRIIGKRVVYLT
ncbi:ABC-type sugar transport system permease subunit [Caldicellulosiruptor bescii]|uniref:Binding-protein-dependent transport systems inner membrane component n=2 Tax=Caldicellulosiruptor bescii TaxID=31899 RepID=B9MM99_CALBD|nr:sugar ABC transporter permease [Caldicellulosiruptor bescii]ACM59331.1 binding-protein-dependent transport systems inner membrane component [Caldicellulosiruptor bescii DSM 6725]PBC88212.1 ABC-type sugar transport system permease subunit [Caldicellulosiruptor bescii]PBC92307.1 ABC-type sugar transport system permease subunit [Caldicellulosiruptor bescii]PBD04882.1 ABC-type sugar transport system permease subunit [Caldicellulosiruptor bescii]PBD05488.1 ABC-type sugar transport system permeas